jgi:hypothetical protein
MQDDIRPEPTMGLLALSLLAISIGIITGFGAVAFRALIGLIHNTFYYGRFSLIQYPLTPAGHRTWLPSRGAADVTSALNGEHRATGADDGCHPSASNQ